MNLVLYAVNLALKILGFDIVESSTAKPTELASEESACAAPKKRRRKKKTLLPPTKANSAKPMEDATASPLELEKASMSVNLGAGAGEKEEKEKRQKESKQTQRKPPKAPVSSTPLNLVYMNNNYSHL